MSIDNLPQELKVVSSWLLAGPDKNGKFKAPYTVKGMRPVLAKWQEEREACLLDFTNAKIHATTFKYGMGFLVQESDEYTVIDFDIKTAVNEPDIRKHTTPERLIVIKQMIDWLNSYTEYSQSGVGYHVIVKGKIGPGLKHGDVEIYSQDRFIVCTGNVYLNKPIENRQELLQQLVAAMPRKAIEDGTELTELQPTQTDDEVMASLWEATNGYKFKAMWQGNFGPDVTNYSLELRPKEHEEACFLDLSLVDHSIIQSLAWRTQSNDQVRRLFSMSPLARRDWPYNDENGNRNKHWNKDGSFNPRHVNLSLKMLRPILEKEKVKREENAVNIQLEIKQSHEILQAKLQTQLTEVSIDSLDHAFKNGAFDTSGFETPEIDWPPGLCGELAQFIYGTAQKPVKEVAIVGALGLLAGITGRVFQLNSTGINLFLILIAKSGVGKEAMHTGVSLILKQMEKLCPEISKFVVNDNFASGQALMKSFVNWPSYVQPIGEVGSLFEKLSMSKMDLHSNFFKTEILQLFNKSGSFTKHGGAKHSDSVNNTVGVYGPAYSMIGDTQPSTLYNCLTTEMMSNGTLSRFVLIEHTGTRNHSNENVANNIKAGMPDILKQKLKNLVDLCFQNVSTDNWINVDFSPEAKEIIRRVDVLTDNIINSTNDETIRQRWNRFKEYIERISSVLAVSTTPLFPTVQVAHVEWAMKIMVRNVIMFDKRLRVGDIGTGDLAREEKGVALLKEYLEKNPGNTYGVTPTMYNDMVFPKRWFHARCRAVHCFSEHRLGSLYAMDKTLEALCGFGDITALSELESKEGYNTRQALYRINRDFALHFK